MDVAQSRKRKKLYYAAPQPKRKKPALKGELCPGMIGILISTNAHEKRCITEAYNILNEYADQLYGPESPDNGDSPVSETDIATNLALEVDRLRNNKSKPRRFRAISSGAKHVVFVQCERPVDPVKLVHHALCDVMKKKLCKSRCCQRFIPVSVVCRAIPEDIQKHVTDVLAPHFYQDKVLLKFAVVYKASNNKDVVRNDIIKTIATIATHNGDYAHTVDLSNPDLTIVVEIIKNNCCVGVVQDFNKLKRYNILSLTEESSHTATSPTIKKDKIQDNDDTCRTCTSEGATMLGSSGDFA